MLSSAQRYLAALIQAGTIDDLLKHGSTAYLFKGHEETLWNYFNGHVRKYGSVPDFALVKADTGFDLAEQLQPAGFYLDRARENHIQQELLATITRLGESHLKPGQAGTPSEALKILGETVMSLAVQKMGAQLHDYRHAYDLIIGAYKAKLMSVGRTGLQLGWPTLDAMTSGLSAGDLVSLIGRPASGKSFLLLWAALYAWREQGKVPLFASMEIKTLPIEQRLIAIQSQSSARHLKDATLTSRTYNNIKEVLLKNQGYEFPFYVLDGNLTATVGDLYALVRQLKPDLVIADGAYLFKHPTERDRYKRVAENVDLLKSQIADLAPTIASWQFARPAKGAKKKPQTLDEIGYSDAIAQHSSLVIGIMEEESIETTKQRKLSILKGRNGEVGELTVRWNFDFTTDFSEVTDAHAAEEEFEVE